MNIIRYIDDYNFVYLDEDHNYREYYLDVYGDGEGSAPVYLSPGGRPPYIMRKRIRTPQEF